MYETYLKNKQTKKQETTSNQNTNKQKKLHSNLMYFNLPRNFRGLPNNLNAYIF